jgi:hypothetical protein
MHSDVRSGKLGKKWTQVAPELLRKSDHDIRGPGTVNKLIEGIKSAQDRNRMTTARSRFRRVAVASVYEADNGHAPAGLVLQLLKKLPGVSTSTNQDDPVR